MALQHLGVGAVLAQSFGRIFYRNALNFGIPVLHLPPDFRVADGDHLQVDAETGVVINESGDCRCEASPLPAHLLRLVAAGGLMPYLKERLAGDSKHAE